MSDSVLSLGEKIVLAARLAAIEHVRQELDVPVEETPTSLAIDRAMAEVAAEVDGSFRHFVHAQWSAFYDRARKGAA